MSAKWTAYPVIEGDAYYVTVERDGVVIGDLPPDVAQGLADQLNDAATPPDLCQHCGDRYAIHGDECDLCNARPAPRWT